jgi:hypothetical protein
MLFRCLPIDFEIPDDWLVTAGVSGFKPAAEAYVAEFEPRWPTAIVPLSQVRPPTRNPGVRWFDKGRMESILRALIAGHALPPIDVHEPPERQDYRYALRDGFHRFYASAATGFPCLPVRVLPYFDITLG